jgi:predicted DNA-binding protein
VFFAYKTFTQPLNFIIVIYMAKTAPLSIRIKEALIQKIDILASLLGKTRSDVVSDAIEAHIKNMASSIDDETIEKKIHEARESLRKLK